MTGMRHAVAIATGDSPGWPGWTNAVHFGFGVAAAWAFARMTARQARLERSTQTRPEARPEARPERVALELASAGDRARIYAARHAVFAVETRQCPANEQEELTDATDEYNVYIVAKVAGAMAGFVAVTPPGRPKALERHGLVPFGGDTHEVRLLAVLPGYRRRNLALALTYAAARYVESGGGHAIEVVAPQELASLCTWLGARPAGEHACVTVGDLRYTHMVVDIRAAHRRQEAVTRLRDALDGVAWGLPFPSRGVEACAHGRGLETLWLPTDVINADVSDAWFPPAPAVLHTIRDVGGVSTTPPGRADELLDALAVHRRVDPCTVVLGAGSSDIIYRCFFAWLTPSSHVLVLTPTCAEYEHVLRAIGCRVSRVQLDPARGYRFTLADLQPFLGEPVDLAVFANPNCPTGVLHADMMRVVRAFARETRVWVDETYIDYAGRQHSLEGRVGEVPNLVVCKSMSKAYALSGVRVAYACAHPRVLEGVKARTPPWIVGRLAQRAAVAALKSEEYYAKRHAETHRLRERLADAVRLIGWDVVEGSCANFVMCRLPPPTCADAVVSACAARRLHIRKIDDRTVRVSVGDEDALCRMRVIFPRAAVSALHGGRAERAG